MSEGHKRLEVFRRCAARDFRAMVRNWATTLLGLLFLGYSSWSLLRLDYVGELDLERFLAIALIGLFGLFLLAAKDEEIAAFVRRAMFDALGHWFAKPNRSRRGVSNEE